MQIKEIVNSENRLKQSKTFVRFKNKPKRNLVSLNFINTALSSAIEVKTKTNISYFHLKLLILFHDASKLFKK